jgi:hypothetical protein
MRKLTMAFVILGWAAAASAQSGEASIRGYIRDEQGAVLPGVTVTASSPTVARIHTSLSDASGSYRLIDLPPGEYTLSAELQGFSKYVRQGVVLRAGLNLNVDVALTVGVVSETVEVRGEAPLLEARSSVQAVNVSGDFQRAVPLSGRRYWHDFMNLIPGMVSTELGNQPFILHGSSFDVHVMQLDGADLAPPSQNTNVYINLSNEALEDVQVKIGAVDASAPLGTGAVINMVTKSGTN